MKVSLLACGVGIVGLLLIAAAGPAYRVGVPLPMALTLFRWGAYVGLAALTASILAAGHAYWRGTRLATIVALFGFALGLTVFGIPYLWQWRIQNLPAIHDISTDLENPPAFEAVLPLREGASNSLERSPELQQRQRQGYPTLVPVTLAMPLPQAFDKALAAAQSSGWAIVTADKSSGRIEATDTTRWFGFKDDVVVRMTPWGTGTRVDVRSASRVGDSDAGTNARRIQSFLANLESR